MRASWVVVAVLASGCGTESTLEVTQGEELDQGSILDGDFSMESEDALTAADAGAGLCALRPTCGATLTLPAHRSWRHGFESTLISHSGSARHRGHDLFVRSGDPVWAIGKFSYGLGDKDLEDEDVDVYLLEGCGASWRKLGTARTTHDAAHATVLGVSDSGGRIYFDLAAQHLGVGRHRVRFVVAGDNSTADAYIEVLPAGARIAVTDIDGTLTTSETASFTELFYGSPSEAHPGAAQVLTELSRRGYYIFYLTARPEWFVGRTRNWLALRGFPRGVLHTTLGLTGALGSAASGFKKDELAQLRAATGVLPSYAFGNTSTDLAAYDAAGIAAGHDYYYGLSGDLKGGVFHDDYRQLLPGFQALPASCP